MKYVSTKRVKIDGLKLPGDWKKILKSDDAADLAGSLAHVPILQRPGVRKSDKTVIWGRHRIAALAIRGEKYIDVDIWDCTDDEIELAADAENAFRKAPNTAARLRLIERWAKEIEDGPPDIVGTPVPTIKPVGRPKAAKTEARERMAAVSGVKTETLRKQEQREKAETTNGHGKAWGDDPEEKSKPEEPSWLWKLGAFESWGLDHLITEDFAMLVVQTRQVVDKLDAAFRRILGELKGLTDSVAPAVAADMELQTLYSRMQQQGNAIRAQKPVALCPYCKGVSDLVRNCRACRGGLMVGQDAVDRAPESLRARGEEAGVFIRPNEFRRLSELAA